MDFGPTQIPPIPTASNPPLDVNDAWDFIRGSFEQAQNAKGNYDFDAPYQYDVVKGITDVSTQNAFAIQNSLDQYQWEAIRHLLWALDYTLFLVQWLLQNTSGASLQTLTAEDIVSALEAGF